VRKEVPLGFEAVVAECCGIGIGIDRREAQGVPVPRRCAAGAALLICSL
jgi:hypothetical protein